MWLKHLTNCPKWRLHKKWGLVAYGWLGWDWSIGVVKQEKRCPVVPGPLLPPCDVDLFMGASRVFFDTTLQLGLGSIIISLMQSWYMFRQLNKVSDHVRWSSRIVELSLKNNKIASMMIMLQA